MATDQTPPGPTVGANPLHVIQGEVYVVVSNMRRNARWASLHHQGEEDPLLQNFKQLKALLATTKSTEEVDAMTLVYPFLEVVTCENTSGPITGVALSSINKFLTYNTLGRARNLEKAISNIANAVTHTRFVFTDVDSDEVVLMKLLQVLRSILLLPVGDCLPDEAVCEMIQAVFRISSRTRLSMLLRRCAEQTLFDMVVRLFGRLDEFREEAVEPASMHDILKGPQGGGAVIEKAHTQSEDELDSKTKDRMDGEEEGEGEGGGEEGEERREKKNNGEEEGEEGVGAAKKKEAEELKPPTNGMPPAYEEDGQVLIETIDGVVRRPSTHSFDFRIGVDATPSEQKLDTEAPRPPYGLPCIRELFRFLTSLCNPNDTENTDPMVRLGITLLTVAIEIAGPSFPRYPTLMGLVRNEMCRHMFAVAKTDSLQLFTLTLRLSLLTFIALRPYLKFQLERFLDLLMSRIDQPHYSPEHQEMALDTILQLCRQPGFVVELYVNYDCNLFCSDLLERLMKFLSEHSFPANGQLLSTHMLALEGLFSVVDAIDLRCRQAKRLPSHPLVPKDETGLSLHKNLSLPALVVEDGQQPPTHRPQSPMVFAAMRHARSMTSLAGSQSPMPGRGQLLSAASLRELRRNKQLLLEASTLFNEKPAKGVKFLQERGMIPSPPEPFEDDLVVFLRTTPQLDKAKIGEFIGRPDGVSLLKAYTRTINMAGQRIDNSLRDFLEGFRLPGEAQIIFRILEAFGEQYHRQNPGVIEDTDSVFVLAYAIIMLNVDQHNPRVKKRMTPDDFIKNQRGLHNGKNFERAYLEEIYASIKHNEIIMPDEAGGATYENYFWSELLKKGNNALYGEYISTCSADYDHDMFLVIWSPAVAAIRYIFDTAQNESIVQRAIGGFKQCATLAAHFQLSEVFDKMVISLSNFTGLLSDVGVDENGKQESLAVVFGLNYRAHLAAVTMFSLARENGDMLREGWKNILECMRRMLQAKLLPPSMLALEDFLEGTITLQEPKKQQQQQRDGWIASTLYWALGSEVQQEENQVDVQAKKAAEECLGQCRIPELFMESRFLKVESLVYLTRALVHASQPQAPSPQQSEYSEYQSAGEYDEEAAMFFLENLVNVTLANKDRIHHVWHIVFDHLTYILAAEPTPRLADRAVVALFRLGTRLYHNTAVSSQVLGALTTLLRLDPKTAAQTVPQTMAGMGVFLRANMSHIETAEDWESILTLLASAAASHANRPQPKALASRLDQAIDVLTELVTNHLTCTNYVPCLRCLHRLIITATPQAEPQRPHRHSNTQSKANTFLSQAMGLIFALYMAAPTLAEGQEDESKPVRLLWSDYWRPLLRVLCELGCNMRSDIRTTAITFLERALLLPALNTMKPGEWESAVREVLFPMLGALLSPELDRHDPRGIDETRFRMVGLLCKVLRQHRMALLGIADFPQVWVQTLELIGRYMHANNSEYLLESVPESLKITLLVLISSGILRNPQAPEDQQTPAPAPLTEQQAEELWTLTWETVGRFLPTLMADLYPPQQPSQPPTTSPRIDGPPPPAGPPPAESMTQLAAIDFPRAPTDSPSMGSGEMPQPMPPHPEPIYTQSPRMSSPVPSPLPSVAHPPTTPSQPSSYSPRMTAQPMQSPVPQHPQHPHHSHPHQSPHPPTPTRPVFDV